MINNNKFEIDYKNLLKECLNSNSKWRNNRTNISSKSLFNKSISVNIKEDFPIITGRKISQTIFNTEFDWFINGETNTKRFKNKKIKIWDAWANEDGNLGPVYGYQMNNFNGNNINQLNNVIHSIKTDPNSRRHIISLWNPSQLEEMALPPCYLYFQFYVEKNKLNMFVLQRSGDLFLGIPYDICLFSKFLLYIAEKTKLEANILSINIIDAHIYTNQVEPIKEYLGQKIHNLPEYFYENNRLELINYKYSKIITAKVAI